jgi:hypothetical protein
MDSVRTFMQSVSSNCNRATIAASYFPSQKITHPLPLKVRLVAHALEGLWTNISRSHLKRDRAFCQVRHSMHFFVSNLLFHLQVLLTACDMTKSRNPFFKSKIRCQKRKKIRI